jgi:hypothetical protein
MTCVRSGTKIFWKLFKHETGVTVGEAGYWLGCSESFGGVEEEERTL